MDELIKIDENSLVSGRELHEFLEVKTKFTDWITGRIKKYEFIEKTDYTIINLASEKSEASWGGQNKTDYVITIDMAKELSMVENNSKGSEARKYFIKCEKKVKEIDAPKNYLEALEKLVETERAKQLAESERNRLIHIGKLYRATEIAKELGFKSAQSLNNQLEKDGIQYKVNGTWVLKTKYSDKNYTSIKLEEYNGKIIYDRMWTGEGRDFLLGKYCKEIKCI